MVQVSNLASMQIHKFLHLWDHIQSAISFLSIIYPDAIEINLRNLIFSRW